MARNHLRFSVDAWRDDDWLGLSANAQWLFVALLSQPKMTLVGSLDVNPLRWATLSRTMTVELAQEALDELTAGDFVLVDDGTCELVVRSFTKNDLSPSRVSSQIAKGFWSAWKGLASATLREAVVDNCPDAVWEKLEEHAPDDARNRRSPPIDRKPPTPSDREQPPPIDNPEACYLKPAASSQQPVDETHHHREGLFSGAVEVLVRQTMKQRPPKTNPAAYERTLRTGKHQDHHATAMELLEQWGDDMPEAELAFFLEPHLFPTPPTKPAANQSNRFCGSCSGSGWVEAPGDCVTPCPDCVEARA